MRVFHPTFSFLPTPTGFIKYVELKVYDMVEIMFKVILLALKWNVSLERKTHAKKWY